MADQSTTDKSGEQLDIQPTDTLMHKKSYNMAATEVSLPSTTSDHDSPKVISSSNQGQFYVGSDDENETPRVEVTSPPPTTLSDVHLSFADLMAYQNRENFLPASDTKRLVGASSSPDKLGASPSSFDSYNPLLHERRPLDEEFRKVFDEDHTPVEPYRLKMDFSNSALASESPGHPEETRYGENDFQSHRRSNVHMYQPMSTHLSARDLKTIQSAQKIGSGEKSSSSKKRRQKPPTLSSADVQKISQEKRTKKKKRKAKKSKRRSLTSKLRDQPSSIPEEDESESGEEEEEEKEEESGREEEDGDDEESEGEGEKGDEPKREDEDVQVFNREDSSDDRGMVEQDDGEVAFIQEDKTQCADERVLFSVGDTPFPSAGPSDEVENSVPSAVSLSSPIISLSSIKSQPISSSSDSDETDKQAQTKRSVSLRETEDSKRRHKKQHRHRHHRKSKSVQIQRRMSGLKLKEMEEKKSTSMMDEDGLQKADIDEMNRHRFDENIGIRKHLLHRPVKKQKMRTEIAERKVHDRKPHEIFVELDEFVGGEWKETARWIKFEEDVEESEMWGKPRVASLSFHSLLELRRTIEKGAVMLDVECNNLTELANLVVDEMVKTGQIKPDDQGHVLRTLLAKHKHHMLEMGLQYNLSKASFSNFFHSTSHTKLNTVAVSPPEVDGSKPLLDAEAPDIESGRSLKKSRSGSTPDHSVAAAPSAKDFKIMRKIPEGAEATAVLVGNLEFLDQPTMAFVRLSEGKMMDNLVALPIPVRFVFVLLGPATPDYNYHEIGRSISTLMADKEFRIMAYAAEDRKSLLRAINEFLDDSIVLPPGQLENPDLLKNISKYQDVLAQRKKREKLEQLRKEMKEKEASQPPEDDDPLRRTKRCFGGLIRDVKRRYPLYWSDIRDAFNLQCLSSIIFIYFAALSPAITFGGLIGEKTDGWIGVSEMILGCCIGGCAFGLFSGQPLLVVGSTGPLIVFEEAVFQFCIGSGLPYLASRFWIGLWICVICVLVVAFEGSFLVRYITRFTQEIFSVLISVIFIYETFKKLAQTFKDHPLMSTYPVNQSVYSALYNCTFENSSSSNGSSVPEIDRIVEQPNTALLSTLLMLGTFIIAYLLRQFKNSKFFRSPVRRTIGDFGVPIAIIIMLAVDIAIKDVYTQKLNVPKGISPTNSTKRGWLVDPLGGTENPIAVWMIFAASIPAFLVFILIFMESHITEVIVSAKERKLKKGSGFHLNLLVLGIINVVLSTFGMPWVCCAAVRSITHTNSLTIMSSKVAPGEKPQIEGVREQRVTVFVVNAFLGLSILMQPLLKEIPLAVLFGIFLYMGVTSLAGVQFVDRIEMLFMPAKHYPDLSYVRMVRAIRIHLFTLIEGICLAILWVVKSTAAQIAFPFALVLTVPLRFFVLSKIFSKKELKELDSDDSQPSVTTLHLDEYNDAQIPD